MAKSLYRQLLANHTGVIDLERLGDIYLLFQACQSVEEACHITRHWFRRNFPEVSGDIALYSDTHDFLKTVTSWGDEAVQSDCFRPVDCWAVRRGRPHQVGVGGAEVASCRHYGQEGGGWHLCLPLMAAGEALGVLHFHGGEPIGCGDAADTGQDGSVTCCLEDISESLSMAIAGLKYRETLQHQAIRDPLTLLFNRRYLEDTLVREMHQADRLKEPLTFAILDVDHFKQFNDSHGHDAGDAVLRAVGKVLSGQIRGGDIACRFGGEEFALVYPGMPEEVAFRRLESIRDQIGKLSLSHRGSACEPVTISAGIAVYPDHAPDTESLIGVADQALYRSKEAGRNRVTMAPGPEQPGAGAAPLKLVHDRDHAAKRKPGAKPAGAAHGNAPVATPLKGP